MRFSVFRPLFDQQFQAFGTVANCTEISWDVSWVKLSLTKYLQMFSVFYPLAYWLTKKKTPHFYLWCVRVLLSHKFSRFFFRFNFPFNFAFVFVISLFLLDCLFRYSLFFTRLVWKFVLFNECWIKLLLLLLLCFLRHNVFHCLIMTCPCMLWCILLLVSQKKVSFELGFVLRKDYERSVFYVRGQKFYLNINLVE